MVTPAPQRRVGLPALLPYLREHTRTLVVVGVLSLIAAGAALMQPVLVRTVLDGIAASRPVSGAVATLVALLLAGAALSGLRDVLLQRTAEGLVLTTRRRLAGHLLRLPIAEYDTRRTGDLLSRVGADTTLLRAVVTSGMFEVVTGVVMVIGAAVAMALLDPLLLGVALGGLAVGMTVAITVGDLVAFILFLFFLVLPLGGALRAYTQLQTGLGALQRIEEILDVPAETAGDRTAPAVAVPAGAPAVVFDNVSFGYPGGGPVLHDVSFTVPYGTRTALVGPSGAGKSTLLALVERFYEITGGSIRVDGTDIRDLPRDALRRRLGYVEQEAPVLAGTLRDNLLLTAPDAGPDRLLEVLDEVNLGNLVTRAPEGLDVQVGEGGVLLSGGERQRLAIARTLLGGAPILLLDEPTSNLDARNEAALRTAIATAASRRTLMVVAHRLSTVVDSDQIVVLEGGRVVAVGPHEQLLDTSPLYRELATHQLLVS